MENAVEITLNGKSEQLVFTTAALKAVQDKYGSMQELVEAFVGQEINEWDDDDVRARKIEADRRRAESQTLDIVWWLIALLANQGRMLKDTKAELLTDAQVGLYLMPKDVEKMLNACMEAIAKGTGTYHNQDEKPTDPILEEVEKNAVGAGN